MASHMVDSPSRFFGDAEVTDNWVMSMFEIRGSEVYATSANDRYDDTSTPRRWPFGSFQSLPYRSNATLPEPGSR